MRRDDGFGVHVARRLQSTDGLPETVRVIELGIAGISLVQELMAERYRALIIIDAVPRSGKAGSLHLMEATVPELSRFTEQELHSISTEPHTTEPSRALVIAKALDVLPDKIYILACEPEDCDELTQELSEPVEKAVQEAIVKIRDFVRNL